LVHWGVNRHTVDKSGGLSVIIPKNYYNGLFIFFASKCRFFFRVSIEC